MLFYLILAFTIIPIIELAILIKVGQHIGALNTISIVILTGIAGAFLAKSQGLITLYRIQEDMEIGKMPTDKLFDGILILAGGILLLTPGLITDGIGFLMLIPLTRKLIKGWIKGWLKKQFQQGRVIHITSFRRF